MNLRSDADKIIEYAIRSVLPDEAVRQALEGHDFGDGRIRLVSIGKAAWQMASTAVRQLESRIDGGIVITKYGHVKGEIPCCQCVEAGHPIPDENSFYGTALAMDLVQGLSDQDTVLFLISGGGSALFEKPLISAGELQEITGELLACGADIVEINTIRKRLSAVKGGKFAELCSPAKVYSVVLSDILGDPLDMIASGPAWPDSSTCEEAVAIAGKYHLHLSEAAWQMIRRETPEELHNVETRITGSVKNLCRAAKECCESLGYETTILTDSLDCEAREAGAFLGAMAKTWAHTKQNRAFIAGGETIVHLTGQGLGGRNQELALSAAGYLAGLEHTAIFSVGSDGTDGPTDAAGGYCDGDTMEILEQMGLDLYRILQENDAYHALEKTGGLIRTGATGTNVNDVAVLLIKGNCL